MGEFDIALFRSKAYVRSKWSYTFQCAFEYFISLLVIDSFLAVLLSYLGISESVIGVLSSLISLMFLIELFAIPIVRKLSNTKKFAVAIHLTGDLFFLCLYLIPFIPGIDKFRTVAAVICIVGGYAGNYLVTDTIFNWGNSFVDPHKRGDYSATKVMISLAGGMTLTVSVGYVMEGFKNAGNLEGWFLFATIAILIFTICDITCLLIMKNRKKSPEEVKNAPPLSQAFKATLGNKYFVNTVILESIYKFGLYITYGFMGMYKNLLFSVGTVQIINCCASIFYFLAAKPLGRYSDKHSFAKGIELGIIAQALAFSAVMFTTDKTAWLLIVYSVFNGICNAGVGQNLLFLSYNYVDAKYFVQACAIKSAISGILGFVASLIGSALYTFIQGRGNVLFGIKANPQQFMAAITVLFMIIAIVFDKLVIEKQKTMLQ